MTFVQRIKKEKKFRFMVVAVSALLLMFFFSSGSEKKEFQDPAICSQFGSALGLSFKAEQCIANDCFPVARLGPLIVECLPCAEVGAKVIFPDGCCSGKAKENIVGTIKYFPVTTFIPITTTEYTCTFEKDPANSREREIGGVVQDMGLFENDAKAAYITAIIGGALIAFVMLSMFL